MTLDEDTRGCQMTEPYENCTTRVYKETVLEECGCIPFSIWMNDRVRKCSLHQILTDILQYDLCGPEEFECVKNLNVDYSKCLQSCEGLLITSTQKKEPEKSVPLIENLYKEYSLFKINFTFPENLKG